MKTKQIKNISAFMVGMLLITLTTNGFGQLLQGERLLCMNQQEDTFFAAIHFADQTLIKDSMVVPNGTTMTEEELHLELWMTIPFEKGISEENLKVESWMTIPWSKIPVLFMV